MPTEYRFAQIDAFASRPFEGNPAAVFRLDDWLDDSVLQAIAMEMNLAETAFLTPCADADADFHLRWFTPAVEVEMCGHATLASGHHVLGHEPARRAVRFKTRRAGVLSVARDGERLRLDLPAWRSAEHDMPALAQALGSAPQSVRVRTGATADSFIAVFPDEASVLALAPDFRALARLGNMLFVATAAADEDHDYDVVSRVFVPGAGIDEDPVTGAAHAFLAPYWTERLGRDHFRARQASPRGGLLDCRLVGDRVALTGRCVKVVDGVLTI